jgi:hypothetical protein
MHALAVQTVIPKYINYKATQSDIETLVCAREYARVRVHGCSLFGQCFCPSPRDLLSQT